MQGIRPEKLTPRELLRYVYMQNFTVSKAWVEALVKALLKELDGNK